MRRLAIALLIVGCATVEPPDDGDPCPYAPTAALPLPAACVESEACPQEDADRPWRDSCGRAYLCPIDGESVCVRELDCACLADYADACGVDVPLPSWCP